MMIVRVVIPKLTEKEYVSFCDWCDDNNITHVDEFIEGE